MTASSDGTPDPGIPRLRVLHVVESYGGGVASAIREYVRSTPELEHLLLRRIRRAAYAPDGDESMFSEILELSGGYRRMIRTVRRAARENAIDVVHAHSSYAGAYARMAVARSRRLRIVYTPHCFATERLDLPRPARWAFGIAEWLLALNTDVVAACSEHERRAARGLPARRRPVLVPNTIAGDLPRAGGPNTVRDAFGLAGAGRLSRQKDPELFARIVAEARRLGMVVEATWLGGGDPGDEARLRSRGVDVTGWLPRPQLLDALKDVGAYVHTAAWEGFPMAILEASAIGVPVLAKRIPALAGAPSGGLFDDERDAVQKLAHLASDPDAPATNRAEWSSFLASNTAEHQRRALLQAYLDNDRPVDGSS